MKFYPKKKKATLKDKLPRSWRISRHGLQHSLPRQLETGANVERKRPRAPKVINVDEDKHSIIESKRNKGKTAPGFLIALDSN